MFVGPLMDLADDEEVDDVGLDGVEAPDEAVGSVGSSQIGSGSRTVPMVLTWNQRLPKVRSNPSWKDPKARR